MDFTRRQFTTGVLAAGAASALQGCIATNPATGRTSFTGMYSVEDDIRIGRTEAPKLTKQFGGVYEDARIGQYVTDIGKQLASNTEMKDLPYNFTILNSPIVNAFALPGGYVFISRGLLALASNEAEMAGVLAHELGHVNARHTAERLSQAMLAQVGLAVLGVATGSSALSNLASYGAQAYIQGFSRSQEFEADMLGARYMSRAGYDPEASVTFLSTLREQSMLDAKMKGLPPGKVDEFNMMSTHPRTVERVKKATEAAETLRPANPKVGRDIYLALINGLMYGDDPDQGMIFDRRFVHPPLRIEYTVPEGFRLVNGQDKVVAEDKQGAAVVFDMGKAKSSNTLAAYLTGEWAKGARVKDVESITVNGLMAATGATKGTANGKPVDIRLLAIEGDDKDVFRFMFLSPSSRTAALGTDFRRTTYSFRRLSEQEAKAVRARRLVVIKSRSGDTVDGLAKTLPLGEHSAETFRILNDMKPGEALVPGRALKVIAT